MGPQASGPLVERVQRVSRVVPSHLMDRDLFDFAGLAHGRARCHGDTAFDAVDPEDEADTSCGDTPQAAEPGAIAEQKIVFSRS